MARRSLPWLVAVAALGAHGAALAGALSFAGMTNGQTAIIDSGPGAIVGTIPAAGAAIALTPNGRRVFLANTNTSTVRAVDVATRSIIHTFAALRAPGLSVTPDGTRLYAASIDDDSVRVFDAATYALMGSITVGDAPVCIAMDPSGQLAYVSNFNSGSLSRVDVPTNAIIPGAIALGGKPAGLVFHPTLPRAYVSNYALNAVQVIDTVGSSVMATIAVGGGPDSIAVTAAGDRVFVANTLGNSVSVIDVGSSSVVATLATGYPGGLGVLPDGRVHALCGSSVCVVDAANAIAATIALPAYAYTYGDFVGPVVVAPDVPTAVVATPGNAEALVSFAPGASDGGLAPFSYTVEVSPGGAEVSGASSPIRVTGLTNGSAYSFRVRAANLVGSSGHSAASGPVTPSGPPSHLLTVTMAGTGRGNVYSSSPASPSIGCPPTCSASFPPGTVVTLTLPLRPAVGYQEIFAGWSGDCTGTGACTVTMDQARNVTATFNAPPLEVHADLRVSQVANPDPAAAGKDVVLISTVFNDGPATSTTAMLINPLPAGATFVWASPGCGLSESAVYCQVQSLPSGGSTAIKVVWRSAAAGTITNEVTVWGSTEYDPDLANNTGSLPIAIAPTPAGAQVLRYRLYSPVTLEHHFTTDLNEYNTLGSFAGTWVQEGTVGKVLDNPGSFDGVEAVPYYRLYDTATRWHHWTTDPNEYYTLAMFPWWQVEGVDGWILPTATAGATQLYRLLYPAVPGLHHWTIDAVEYNQLISVYGWIGEGGAGFVIE